MPSTFFGLTIGQSGLNASQIGINTTGHNISNENTKGYSRQITDMQASTPIRSYSSSGMMGSGTDVTGISQIRELYYDRKYWSNETNYGRYEALDSYMKQLENTQSQYELEQEMDSLRNDPKYENVSDEVLEEIAQSRELAVTINE